MHHRCPKCKQFVAVYEPMLRGKELCVRCDPKRNSVVPYAPHWEVWAIGIGIVIVGILEYLCNHLSVSIRWLP